MNIFKSKITVAVLAGVILLSGCKGLEIKTTYTGTDPALMKKYGTQASTKAINATNPQKPAAYKIIKFAKFTVKKRLNLAFYKLKKEFHFQSPDEVRAEYGSNQSLAGMYFSSGSYTYETIDGVYYHVKKFVKAEGQENVDPTFVKAHLLDVLMEAVNDHEVTVEVKYWTNKTPSENAVYEKWINMRLDRAFGRNTR